MADPQLQILRDAIARNSAVVLSLPSAGMLRHQKSRFLTEEESGFWVESAPGERLLIKELLATAQPVAVSFRSGANKVIFTAPLRNLDPAMRLNDDTQVEALLVAHPLHIKTIQRRHNYRVKIASDADLRVRLWKITEHAHLSDRPLAAQEIKGTLRDLSIGGLGINLQAQTCGDFKIVAGQRLRIELQYRAEVLLLEGHLRSGVAVASGEVLNTGVSFKPLDNQIEGRQKLAQLSRIVGELQRDEVRRARHGIF